MECVLQISFESLKKKQGQRCCHSTGGISEKWVLSDATATRSRCRARNICLISMAATKCLWAKARLWADNAHTRTHTRTHTRSWGEAAAAALSRQRQQVRELQTLQTPTVTQPAAGRCQQVHVNQEMSTRAHCCTQWGQLSDPDSRGMTRISAKILKKIRAFFFVYPPRILQRTQSCVGRRGRGLVGLWKVSFGGGAGGGGARSAYLCSGSRVASLVKVTERDTRTRWGTTGLSHFLVCLI